MSELSLDEWLQMLDDMAAADRDAFAFSTADRGPQRAVDSTGQDIGDGIITPGNFIEGGDGDDLILGGPNAETLIGNGGSDTIGGFSQDDSIFGGVGGDMLDGDDGNDFIEGGGGKDTIGGGHDADMVFGGGGRDIVDGDRGRDVVNGGGGKDTLFGGAGKDRIEASGGRDEMNGGGGRDTFAFTGRQKGEIFDFNLRRDKIEIDNGDKPPLEFEDLKFRNIGDDVLIKAGAMRILIKFENVDSADDVPKGIFLFE